MHENLQEMIKEVTKEEKPVEDNIEISTSKVEKTEKKEEAKKSKIGVLSLYDWFEKNKGNFCPEVDSEKIKGKIRNF